jgi:hypothetical protein
VAEAGLLAGRTATTHWLCADRLAAMYPTITVRAGRLLIDHGDVITSGGATTFVDLSALLGRAVRGSRAGQRRCSPAAHRPRHSRLPYVLATGTGRDHRDSLVHQLLDLSPWMYTHSGPSPRRSAFGWDGSGDSHEVVEEGSCVRDVEPVVAAGAPTELAGAETGVGHEVATVEGRATRVTEA